MPLRPTKDLIEDEVDDDILDEEDEEDEDIDGDSGGLYEPSEKLQENHWQRRTVADLVEMMSTPYLVLNPDYQRDVVWSADRMTKLINSLICNYYVPPVIFNVQKVVGEDGSERYKRISIDGKQRLSSIRAFVNGDIPCTDKSGKKWYFANNGDSLKMNKRILDEKFKKRFLQHELLCAEYAALERKQEEDLFSRVQLGVPLTPAEKLRASSGDWQAFAIDIEKQYPQLMDTVDNRRGRSFQLVLQILKQILNSDNYNPKYSAGAAALKGFCDRPSLLDESFKATARRVFNTYNEIRKKHPETFENHAYSHATKYSPIEFVGSAVLIHQYPHRNNPSLLSGDILLMRSHLRKNRQDLRSNTSTWKCLIEFVNELEGYRGGMNVTGRERTQEVQDMSMEDAGEGGSSQFLPPLPHKSPPIQLEMQPATPAERTKGGGTTKVPLSTDPSPAPSPAPSTSSLPPRSEMNVRTGHLRFESQRHPLPQLPNTPPTQQPPTAPLAQRQPPPSPQVRAPIAPLGHTAPRSVADRFKAVNTTPNSHSTPLFGGGIKNWNENDGESGGRHMIESGLEDGFSGRNEYSPKEGGYGGQRPTKRPRTDNELLHQQIKREKGPRNID